MTELTVNWQEDLKGVVNHRIRMFLEMFFQENNIKKPKLQDIVDIRHKVIMKSWLTINSQSELMIFQQEIRTQ